MTLSQREFYTSMGRLTGGDVTSSDLAEDRVGKNHSDNNHSEGIFDVALGGVRGRISVEAIEPVLMGGLVKLPRCKVVIEFGDTTIPQRLAFLNRFDQAFQRGGG